jgi:hypothetical protein
LKAAARRKRSAGLTAATNEQERPGCMLHSGLFGVAGGRCPARWWWSPAPLAGRCGRGRTGVLVRRGVSNGSVGGCRGDGGARHEFARLLRRRRPIRPAIWSHDTAAERGRAAAFDESPVSFDEPPGPLDKRGNPAPHAAARGRRNRPEWTDKGRNERRM